MAIGTAGLILAVTPYELSLETRLGLYSLFHLRGERVPPTDVAIVAIDGRTGEKLGLSELPREWPRSVHGKLVDELTRRGAAAIVFDMDFRRSRDPQHDNALAQAIASSNRVVLFEHLNGRLQPIEDASGRQQGAVWVEEQEPPMPVLTRAARALGPFPLPKLDAAVDQFWTFKSSAHDTPTMPVAALQVFALNHYDKWRALLTQSTAAAVDALPLRAADIRDEAQMKAMMIRVRQLFVQDSQLAARLRTALQNDPDQAWRRAGLALTALYAGDNTRYLNYYGPPGTITTIPYHSVLKPSSGSAEADTIDVKNKVVFVGHSDLFDPGQPDRFYTVFTRDDGVDLSGVEIAATAFANLLTDGSVKPLGAATTALIVVGFGLVVGALLYLAPAVIGVIAALTLSAAYVAAAQWSFNTNGGWWPLATPILLQLPLALLIGLLAQYRLERKRAHHISEAIRAYVPEDVSRILTAPHLDNQSINKVTYGTCLATDMAGFSTIAEKMAPGELAQFLNAYFDVLAHALKRHGVQVTEFRADAIMCAWTGAADDPRVRTQPVRAALDAAKAIHAFNAARDIQGTLRVGLADGEFYVGHAGGGGHFVYSIVGDCANTASRIEGLNKHLGTRILTTSTVLEGQDDLVVRHLGKFRFVNKSQATPISEIIATRTDATDAQLDLCARFTPAQAAFAQREWREAAALLHALARDFPADGPTRFLQARAQAYLNGEAAAEEPGVIAMTAK